jgi:multicomponent Na+:H+ antiporter subunit D
LEIIRNNLPALVVVTPFCMGLLTAIFGRRHLGWYIAMGTSLAVAAMCIQLLVNVLGAPDQTISYLMGNWPVPYGIGYVVDPLNASVLVIVSLVACVTTLYARRSVASEIPVHKLNFFYALWQFCLTGLLGITITGDAFNLYVLLEISSLSTYTLVAMGKDRDRRAVTAAFNYLVLGSIGACFYLIGVAYLYTVTGSLNIADIAARMQPIFASWDTSEPLYQKTVIAGFAIMTVGLSLKLALFPVHGWLPNAYTYSPSAVSALLASTATKVGAYAFIRVIFTLVGVDFAFGRMHLDTVLMVSAGGAILVGSWLAFRQVNAKKLLAYSSIGQIGYITLGFALGNVNGLTSSVIHLFNHALTKGGMFMALGVVAYRMGKTRVQDLAGLGRELPITMGALTVGGLGLIGVPLTAGFVSKWYLVTGCIEAGRYEMAAIVLIGSLVALMYVWRIVETVYFGKRPENAPELKEAPVTMLVPMLLLSGASIYFGIDASLSTKIATAAATFLLGGAP